MAVTSTQTRVAYAGNDVTVAFVVPWYFLDVEALQVWIRTNSTGAEVQKLLTTDYAVAGAGSPAGGTVTMVVAPTSGQTLHILHVPLMTQGLDLAPGAALPAEALEKALDRLTHRAQRSNDKAERSPQLAATDTDGSGVYDARGNRIGDLGAPVSGTDAATKDYVLSQTIVSAVPPDGSLTNAKWNPASPLDLTNVNEISAANMALERDPYPGAVLTPGVHAQDTILGLQYQLRRIMESIDGVARANGYIDPAASNFVPTAIAAAIAALPSIQSNLLPNGSQLVSQRWPSETQSGTTNDGLDEFINDRWFVLPAGGNVFWERSPFNLHTAARSPLGIRLVGAAGITSVRYGIRLGRSFCRAAGALLANKNVTFGVKVRHHGTTGSITPTLKVRSTSNALEDGDNAKFQTANMTERVSQAFPGALTAGTEVAFTHTFDLGAMTNGQNGIEIYVDLGAMNAATIAFTLTDFFLAFGDISADLLPDDFDEQLRECTRHYQKTFEYSTAPAQNITFSGAIAAFCNTTASTGCIVFEHRPELRGNPTITRYNPGALNTLPRTIAGVDATAVSTIRALRSRTQFDFHGASARAHFLHVAADSEWYD